MAVFKIITLIYNKIEANGRKGGEKKSMWGKGRLQGDCHLSLWCCRTCINLWVTVPSERYWQVKTSICLCEIVCYTCQSVAKGNTMYRNSCWSLSLCIWRLILYRILITNQVSRNEGNMQQKEARRERGKVWVAEKINLEKYLKNVCFSLLI